MQAVCPYCFDTGHVCENHPHSPWGGISDAPEACECGAGMPCSCCGTIPQDGQHSIILCFTPKKFRTFN